MNMKINKDIKTTHTGNVAAVTNKKAEPKAVEKKAPLEVPLGPSDKKIPFIGAQLAGQLSRIPQLKGVDISSGNVAYVKKLSEDKFDKFGIFFEAETKLCPIDDAEVPQIKERILQGGDEGKLASILPKGYKGPFANFTMKWDRANSRSGADFHDVYSDDKHNSAYKMNSSVRDRRIGDTPDGKFEVKLPGANIAGSAVLGRFEVATSTGPTRRSKADVIAAHKKGEIDNPLTLLKQEIPNFDEDSLEEKVKVDDVRHQLVLMDASGKDMFLLTLDFVHATRVANGKEGDFVEFEVERMDGSTSEAGLSELIELERLLCKSLGLAPSPSNKYVRAMAVTE